MFYKSNRGVIVGETRVSLGNSHSNYGAFLHRFRARLHQAGGFSSLFPCVHKTNGGFGARKKDLLPE